MKVYVIKKQLKTTIQLTRDTQQGNMVLKQLHILVFLLVGVFFASAQHVKGGRYQQTSNEAGYCYKRIPYHQALSQYNDTESYAPAGYGQPARPHWNDTFSNGYVTVLDCCEGYRKNPSTGRCEATSSSCAGGCFGGSCVNGVCTCSEGWFPVEGVCKPFCRNPCQANAYCFGPDYCECKFGWEKTPSGECKPICPGGCVNGDCVAPKVCQCKPGYILNERLDRYFDAPGDRESCKADCGPLGCYNGECISPGVCVCNIGYVKNLANICAPDMLMCPRGCPANAGCVAPNLCVCNPGLIMDRENNRCVPVAGQPGSQHPGLGDYRQPDAYQPRPGNYNQTGSYQPRPGDYNQPGGYQPRPGDYNQPGGYQPRPGDYNQPGGYQPGSSYPGGYQPGSQPGGYQPGSQPGSYQPGSQPGGYNQQGNYGEAHCDRPCVNGVCMGYNICSCNSGYEQDPLDPSRTHCLPSCPGGCPNGSCSAPNRCICNPGFVKDRSVKGSQRCIPRQEY